MSIQHVGAVLHDMPEIRNRGTALALMAIADSADRHSGWTFDFSMRSIAKAARLTPRGARAQVRELESKGYVRTEFLGEAGRQRIRFRVLFGFDGVRRPELVLYPQPPATSSAGKRKTPATTSAPPATRSAPPATTSAVLNNPNKDIRLSPSLSEERVKNTTSRRIKKIPTAEQAPNVEPERQRQLAELAKLAVAQHDDSASYP